MSKPRGDLQLAIGYWIVSHKDQLRTWWAVSLLTIIGGSFLWTIGFFAVFFVQQAALEKDITATASALADYSRSGVVSPIAPTVSEVTVIRRDAEHVDLVAVLTNPNTAWGIESMAVTWQIPGVAIAPETVFINPDATRPVIALQVAVAPDSADSATVGVSEVVWARASSAPLPDPVFVTSDLALSERTIQTPEGGSVRTVNIRGDILNQSVFNFFRVTVPILVLSGDRIVAVDQVTQTNWPTRSPKTINLTWAYPVSGATAIEANPQVSRFDADNLYR